MNVSNNTISNTHHLSGAKRLFALDLPKIHEVGNIFVEQPDLAPIRRVLDLACGDGTWAINVAKSYPRIQVVAVDSDLQSIEQARMQAQRHRVEKNIAFEVMDSPRSLDDASFDLVNLRFMLGFTDLDQWPGLVEESLRMLPSGGILRLTEADTLITTSAACEQLNDLLAHALWKAKRHLFPPTPYGQNLLITPLLSRLLRDAGFKQMGSTAFTTNFSTGRPMHSEMRQEIIRSYQVIQPLLLSTGVVEQQELESLTQQMLSETEAHDFYGIGFYLTAWGKKS